MRAVVSGVLAGVLAALTLVVDAQPVGAQPADAQPATDRERAKTLYQAAEAAMREARYEDAIRDYGAAYELTKDPALLYKLGSANERAGKCDAAVTYYRRYLRDGKPKEDFAKLTRAKIAACGADPDAPLPPDPAPGPATPPVPAPGPARPDAAGAPTKPDAAGAPAPTKPDAAGAPAQPDAAGAPARPDAAGAPAATAPAPRRGRPNGPWLLVGGSLALVTTGAVLAYSANAAERDVEDLYVGLNGTPPPFNSTTRRLYDDAIAEGRRYQTLSIVSFSLAGAMALGAGLWFALGRDEQITVAPAVSPGSAGVSTTLRF